MPFKQVELIVFAKAAPQGKRDEIKDHVPGRVLEFKIAHCVRKSRPTPSPTTIPPILAMHQAPEKIDIFGSEAYEIDTLGGSIRRDSIGPLFKAARYRKPISILGPVRNHNLCLGDTIV